MRALLLCDDLEPDSVAKLCRKHKIGIEVQSFFNPQYIIDNPDAIEQHKRILAAVSRCSFHGPFAELIPGSMDPMIRGVVRRRFEDAVSIARQLNISEIVLHHGYFPHAGVPKNWTGRFIDFWRDFLKDMPSDLRFHIENAFEDDPNMIVEGVDAIGDSRVDICLDTGHVNCFAKASPVDWVSTFGSRIGYVHLHNNHGDADSHLGLDDGTIDMRGVCDLLEDLAPGAVWALEMKPIDHASSLEWLSQNGFWRRP